MRALLDVKVLIALFDEQHMSHEWAFSRFAANAEEGWATCAITQNGCLRVKSNPGYRNSVPVSAIAGRFAEACANAVHEFWPDYWLWRSCAEDAS